MMSTMMEGFDFGDGCYTIEGRVSAHSEQSLDEVLERMEKATYGSDAVLYHCFMKGYLDFNQSGISNMIYLCRELQTT